MSLRERCRDMCSQMQRNAMLRQSSPVDDLIAFVQAEIGRTADERLEDTCSLILYFGNEIDRAGFKALVAEEKPNWMMKEIP